MAVKIITIMILNRNLGSSHDTLFLNTQLTFIAQNSSAIIISGSPNTICSRSPSSTRNRSRRPTPRAVCQFQFARFPTAIRRLEIVS
jgi:hypothetical protein